MFPRIFRRGAVNTVYDARDNVDESSLSLTVVFTQESRSRHFMGSLLKILSAQIVEQADSVPGFWCTSR